MVSAMLNCLPKILMRIIGSWPATFQRLVPYQRVKAEFGFPAEFHKISLSFLINEAEGIHSEPLHHAVTSRKSPVGHSPHVVT